MGSWTWLFGGDITLFVTPNTTPGFRNWTYYWATVTGHFHRRANCNSAQ